MTQDTDTGTNAGQPQGIETAAVAAPALDPINTDALLSVLQESNSEDAAAPATAAPPVGFDTFGLSDSLMRAITEAGYKTPTPIQAEGIPHAMKRRDLIGIAQTGTGKTASFALPMIELLSRGRAKARMPRSLIIEPTRELAAQVAESFETFTKYNKLTMALLIGGVSFEDQDKKLDRGVDILIATPGRLLDHFERGKLMMSQVQILVIDEADRMLDMGFIPDVERICKLIPFTRQTLFYSATMPTEIRRLTEQFLQNPVRIEVARPATTASTITQALVEVPANDWAKREALRRLIREAGEIKNAIVFCNRKHDVDIVAKSLKKHEFNAAPLHGDLDQSLRTKTLEAFRSGEVQFLVASDVAARGLDIPDVSHVFNFDAPFHPDDYVHRIGRTGRAGRKGSAFMLITPRDEKYVETIEKLIGTKLERRTLDGLADAVRERPQREDRNRSRDRGRERNRGRDRDKRDRPIKPHGQMAAMEPSKPIPAPQRPAAPPPVAPRPQNQAPNRASAHADKRNSGYAGGRDRDRDRGRNQNDWTTPVKPDISELPAFLLRPVPLPKAAPEKAVAAKPTAVKPTTGKPVAPKPTTEKPKAKPAAKPVLAASAPTPEVVPLVAPEVVAAPIAQTVTSAEREPEMVIAPVLETAAEIVSVPSETVAAPDAVAAPDGLTVAEEVQTPAKPAAKKPRTRTKKAVTPKVDAAATDAADSTPSDAPVQEVKPKAKRTRTRKPKAVAPADGEPVEAVPPTTETIS